MKARAILLGQTILLILLVTLGRYGVARFLTGLIHDPRAHETAYRVANYVLVTLFALSILAIGSLLTRASGNPYRWLGFSWEKFSLLWFLAIAALWLLPNVINPLVGGGWKTPEISLALFLAVILAPVFEEVIFRGCLQGSLHDLILIRGVTSWRGIVLVILIQSLPFSLAHFDLFQPRTIRLIPFVMHFVGGASLGFLAYRNASVWPGVAVHLLGNVSAAAAMNG